MPEFRGKRWTNERVVESASARWKSLDLYRTLVDDEGVLEIVSRAPHLHEVSIESTQIGDEGIRSICQLPNLRSLLISQAPKVTSVVIPAISKAHNLRELYLANTAVDDRDLECLSALSFLWSLSLENTGVSDDGIRHLAGCEQLKILDISNTSVRGEGLNTLPDHERLNLYLNSCPLSSEAIMAFAKSHPSTAILSLNATPIDDQCLGEIAQMPKLEDLRIEHTQVTDAGLTKLLGHPLLGRLYVKGTQATPAMCQELKRRGPESMSVFR